MRNYLWQPQSTQIVNVILRVPASQFDAAIDDIRKVGTRILQEKSSGRDVTEEFLDVEARIRTKKALEDQFMEIMKQAKKVSEALEVQGQLADVRTEVEQLEGRRRYLDNQAALSTINLTLQMPVPIVAANTTSFVGSIKQSAGDAVDVAASIILGLIRIIIVLTPVALLILLPLALVGRIVMRRLQLQKRPVPVPVNPGNE